MLWLETTLYGLHWHVIMLATLLETEVDIWVENIPIWRHTSFSVLFSILDGQLGNYVIMIFPHAADMDQFPNVMVAPVHTVCKNFNRRP